MTDERVSDITARMRQSNEPGAKLQPLERLIEAMILVSTINRPAGEAYRFAFKVAAVAAPYGPLGIHTQRHLEAALERLERHLATLSPEPPEAA